MRPSHLVAASAAVLGLLWSGSVRAQPSLPGQEPARRDPSAARPEVGPPAKRVGSASGGQEEHEPRTLEEQAGAAEEESEADDRFRVFWKDGLRMETADGEFRFRLGGRIQNDWAFWEDSESLETAVGALDGGVELRRARLYVSGVLYRHVEFKANYDFAGGDAEAKDVYMGLTDLPVEGPGGTSLNLRIGHFKEPFSLEELTSSKYITFLERALPNVFAPSRNVGVMLHGDAAAGRASYGVGVFRETDDSGFTADDDYNFTARLTGAPVYADEGRRAAHVGVSWTYKSVADGGTLRFRQRPEVHLAPRFVDTGSLAADSATIVGLEGAWVEGPLSVQGEYTAAFVTSEAGGDPTLGGYYLQASYWLTGEQRNYEADGGEFGRVAPRADLLGGEGGSGAWEVALRFSKLDLSDGRVTGGELEDLTVGVNWHWNPMTRLMFNLVRTDLDGVDSAVAAQVRAQIDF